jgi:hypothetical protein
MYFSSAAALPVSASATAKLAESFILMIRDI